MTSTYQRAAKVMFSEIGDDVVALHIERGHCYGMEEVSADIWRMLAEPHDLSAICTRLVENYNVGPENCRAEVGQFIEQLAREGLVSIVASE